MDKLKNYQFSIYAIIAGLIVSACQPASSPELSEGDKKYMEMMTTDAYEGWNEGNREPYLARYSEDVVYMLPNGETVEGLNNVRDYVMNYPEGLTVKFPVVEFIGKGDLINVRGVFTIYNSEGTLVDKGKYLNVWQRNANDKWEVTHDIFNSDMPLPVQETNAQEEEM
ncbi:YybH family protein [Chondrinema litorale]|uniref:YybH family protein n=1 Tax=Chondrinema litorale TaxID=2994555 RepID=UPI00254289B0|nr:DUF4440 domain-containing protein [Chondrinema litorale]UZR97757.1 DUF4440 domain-containing protein [Chondrinema litorale]